MQSTKWPWILVYLQFTLLAYVPEQTCLQHDTNIPLNCCCCVHIDPKFMYTKLKKSRNCHFISNATVIYVQVSNIPLTCPYICSIYIGIFPHECTLWHMTNIRHVRGIFDACTYMTVAWEIKKQFLDFLSFVYINLGSIWTQQQQFSGTYVSCCRHVCSGTYANNVKCSYTSVHGHFVDCIKFKWGIYWQTCHISAEEIIVYMAFGCTSIVGIYTIMCCEVNVGSLLFLK